MLNLRLISVTPKSNKQKFKHGDLFIQSECGKWLDFCHTLEDQVRDINMNGKFDEGEKKIDGETAIPFGKYEGKITYSPVFKRDMPLILNVSEFIGVRMHGGNDIDDTEGCILVAFNADNNGKIWSSAEAELTTLIKQNDKDGKFKIEIL